MPTRTGIIFGWLVLFGISFVLFASVWLLAWWQRPRHRAGDRIGVSAGGVPAGGDLVSGDSVSCDSERAEWLAHHAAVTRQARQAPLRAAAARARADALEQDRDTAWSELDSAHQAYERARLAFEEASQRHDAQAPEPAARREVAAAALAAYRRGDLSREELDRVWKWENGWNPDLDRRERAYLRARARWRDAQTRYRLASSAARTASADAGLAEAEARVLAEELEFTAAYLEEAG